MRGAHRLTVVAAGTFLFVFVGGGSVFTATSSGPDPVRQGPSDVDRAAEVALDEAGGGRVTETEVRDDDSYYEVEVTRDDGVRVDVQIDESFTVVSAVPDQGGSD
jgi:hypothetical protein